MKLYLLRHGHAASVTEARVATDAERPLSDTGRSALRLTCERLLERGGRPTLLLHSPLRRAVESAREAALWLKPAQGTAPFEALGNVLAAEDLSAAVSQRATGVAELMLVGHQPQLGDLAAMLSGQIFELRAGGLIALESGDGRSATVLWSYNPGE